MRTTTQPLIETDRLHHLAENLVTQLARGREWATPGVQVALQRAVAGLDTGIETASPRLQTLIRHLADELATGVQTVTPRVQERLRGGGPTAVPEAAMQAQAAQQGHRVWWWAGVLAAVTATGVLAWRLRKASEEEPPPSLTVPDSGQTDPDSDPGLAAGRM